MAAILDLKLAMSIIDAVLRASRLDAAVDDVADDDALLLGWLLERPGLPGAELAWRCGRTRSNMHRALRRLQALKLVEPLPSVVSGRTCGWTLTQQGGEVTRRLQRRIEAYDQLLRDAEPRIEELAKRLLEAMKRLLRPHDQRAGTKRLVRPERRDRLQQWDW
jgi:DNA-binding MarR family transcriptional regulator